MSDRFLVDTNVVIWTLQASPRVSSRARRQLLDSKTTLLISVVTLWEIILKCEAGKLQFDTEFEAVIDQIVQSSSWTILPVTSEHLSTLVALPMLHRDPFDRILIAQSRFEQLTIITPDKDICRYAVQTLW